jgi:hypothetical protein
MRSEIIHLPSGILLDLAKPDLGHPHGHAIIQAHYHDCHQDRPVFECVAHRGSTNPGLYLKKIRGQWWAVHFEAGTCKSQRIPAPMSDEHKRQAEYWVRAAQDAGWRAETEHNLSTGTRPDVLIHGSVVTGIEVQRSSMSRDGAVNRTKRAAQAGVRDVWFTDRASFPHWAFHVPTVGQQPQAWQYLPPRRAVLANGVRAFSAVRCTVDNLPVCPDGRNWCGRYHPKAEPRVLVLDDIASRFPAGEIVALRIKTMSGVQAGVYLFPAESIALYEELTGRSAESAFGPWIDDHQVRRLTGRVECQSIQGEQVGQALGYCAACRQRFATEVDFTKHQVRGWDGRLICPESPARYPPSPRSPRRYS